jgi:osmotically-inducible protein OsmY
MWELLLVLMIALGLAGCGRETPAVVGTKVPTEEGPETQAPAVSEVGQAVEPADSEVPLDGVIDVEDAALTAKVKTRLMADSRVAALNIDVGGQNGIVTLKGSVKDEQEKAAAEEVARATEGVTDVVNMITPGTGGTP